MKIGLVVLGSIFFGLGMIGIFLPLLPTTPFLLLAATCYGSGSEKWYNWLINHRYFGSYIRSYRSGEGIPLKTKIYVIAMMWVMIGLSAYFATDNWIVRSVLIFIACCVTGYLSYLPTKRNKSKHQSND